MLVLSRKKNESIIINGNIEIKIIESDDGKVRIGIDAPKDIEIHRKEVYEQIMAENKAAASSNLKLENLSGANITKTKTYNKKVNIKNKKLL